MGLKSSQFKSTNELGCNSSIKFILTLNIYIDKETLTYFA